MNLVSLYFSVAVLFTTSSTCNNTVSDALLKPLGYAEIQNLIKEDLKDPIDKSKISELREAIKHLAPAKSPLHRLTDAEIAAIYAYSGSSFPLFNDLKEYPERKYQQLRKTLQNALKKMPAFRGLVRRYSEAPLLSEKPGDRVILSSGFLSTSVTQPLVMDSALKEKARPDDPYFHFEIESYTGRPIEFFARDREEHEVLFPPNTEFEILSISGIQEIEPGRPKGRLVRVREVVNWNEMPPLFLASPDELPIGRFIQSSASAGGGTQGALWYRNTQDEEWLLKPEGPVPERMTAAEVITSQIYKALGFNAPSISIIYKNGRRFAAVRKLNLPRGSKHSDLSEESTAGLNELYFFAALLKDWDRITPNEDTEQPNNFLSPQGEVFLFDFGGSLGSRAMGDAKPMLDRTPLRDAIGGFENTKDGSIIVGHFSLENARRNHPWKSVDRQTLVRAMTRLERLDDLTIESIVYSAQYSDAAARDQMIDSIKNRRDGLKTHLLNQLKEVVKAPATEEDWVLSQTKVFTNTPGKFVQSFFSEGFHKHPQSLTLLQNLVKQNPSLAVALLTRNDDEALKALLSEHGQKPVKDLLEKLRAQDPSEFEEGISEAGKSLLRTQ